MGKGPKCPVCFEEQPGYKFAVIEGHHALADVCDNCLEMIDDDYIALIEVRGPAPESGEMGISESARYRTGRVAFIARNRWDEAFSIPEPQGEDYVLVGPGIVDFILKAGLSVV